MEHEEGEERTPEKGHIRVAIDLRSLYEFDPEDVSVDISVVRYSNLAYIQVSHRDVHIDFLEMPGIKKDGKTRINGTRIYMSHAAAQKLARELNEVLERVHSSGGMEKYQG
ncbi:MAG TPA: DUF3467 domain-containing protein [Candidatus Syntrophoarchaeum butanivorans]|uniref:DUF3467 domain-containing protein n=1 Tax=Candidatus Syntropharchaeum butanivorans TaxID=1839936 RepID=A0A1F2P676_9EURY|nr:MAG: hypothetical protein SBU_000093 [Candidatus Syntrophoarchaeum butanivorans]HEC57740.1 DUF3467 domain-containing protein [Candidatus Syntrophoarchaeum butanivorans]